MKNFQKGSVNVWLVVIILILLVLVGYFVLIKKPTTEIQQINITTETIKNNISNNETSIENDFIQKLLSSWKITQSKFSTKAGESGTFNPPSKIQFISADTVLAYYDDGLVDHISVVQLKNNSFVELKNVGVMSTMTQAQWLTLVNTYGSTNYPVSNYQSSDYKTFSKVSSNIFVR